MIKWCEDCNLRRPYQICGITASHGGEYKDDSFLQKIKRRVVSLK
jgi:hypothetical protein